MAGDHHCLMESPISPQPVGGDHGPAEVVIRRHFVLISLHRGYPMDSPPACIVYVPQTAGSDFIVRIRDFAETAFAYASRF